MDVVKHLFLLVTAASAATNICFAQTYSITPDDTLRLAGQMEDFQTLTITQHNTSGKAITLKWRKLSESIPEKWDALVCDNQVCYASLVDSGTMNPILPGDSAFLFVKITGHVNYGTAVVRYALWDIDNPALKDTLTFMLTIDNISAIEKGMAENVFSLFPNPARNWVNIISDLQTGFTYSIISSAGLEHMSGLSHANAISIPVENLSQGIYFLQIRSDNKIFTQKIIIQ